MKEILPGVFHWTSFHEGIGEEVHSYFLTATRPALLIDPREPAEGLEWFRQHGPPAHALLTNRHHYRHSGRFADAFGTTVWCHRAGLHEFTNEEAVRPFGHGDLLPGGIEALEVGTLCPEETAFLVPAARGLLALGDAVIRVGSELSFVPGELMGDDPDEVRQGLRGSLAGLLDRDFRHLLLAHGSPAVEEGREELRRFLEGLSS